MAYTKHNHQKKLKNRLIITLPLFLIVIGLSIWNFADAHNFNILWHWFAWSNQVIAAFTLCIITVYLLKDGKYKWGSLISAIPAAFMCAITITYLLGEPNIALGRFIPMYIAIIVGISLSIIGLLVYFIFLFKDRVFSKKVDNN